MDPFNPTPVDTQSLSSLDLLHSLHPLDFISFYPKQQDYSLPYSVMAESFLHTIPDQHNHLEPSLHQILDQHQEPSIQQIPDLHHHQFSDHSQSVEPIADQHDLESSSSTYSFSSSPPMFLHPNLSFCSSASSSSVASSVTSPNSSADSSPHKEAVSPVVPALYPLFSYPKRRSSPPAAPVRRVTQKRMSTSSPGPIPATVPTMVQRDENGVDWIGFVYSKDRVKTDYTIRCDIESVSIASLRSDFKQQNCIYPRACVPPDQYKGNRQKYETECNSIGWCLSFINPQLRGQRGLIQRAVDSWRNTNANPSLRSRRVRRMSRKQEKLKCANIAAAAAAAVTTSSASPMAMAGPVQYMTYSYPYEVPYTPQQYLPMPVSYTLATGPVERSCSSSPLDLE